MKFDRKPNFKTTEWDLDIIVLLFNTFPSFQLARKHGAGGRESRHTDVVEELKNAFEVAERNSPGITNRYFLHQIVISLNES